MTETIYGFIRDQQYAEAVSILTTQQQTFPRSRAALSLLGYCYYMLQNYAASADMYDQLTGIYPENREYMLYQAQSLFKAAQYDEALKICSTLKHMEGSSKEVSKLLAAIHYEKRDYNYAVKVLDQIVDDDPDKMLAQGCTLYQQGRVKEALTCFEDARKLSGDETSILYNIALCYNDLGEVKESMKILNQLIAKAYATYPSLGANHKHSVEKESKFSEESVGFEENSLNRMDSVDFTSGFMANAITNSEDLKQSSLVEAYNLKAAIYFNSASSFSFLLNPNHQSRKALLKKASLMLTKMPFRHETELDPVTLHNSALFSVETDLAPSLKKLTFLLDNPPFPKECFTNLLILFLKNNYGGFAADLVQDNEALITEFIERDQRVFYEATILASTRPEEAYIMFHKILQKSEIKLRQILKEIGKARATNNTALLSTKLAAYEDELEKYLPSLMQLAKIFWEKENYKQVEKQLRKGSEFCTENKAWQLNVAHCFFMQDGRYKESIHYYELLLNTYFQKDSADKTDFNGSLVAELDDELTLGTTQMYGVSEAKTQENDDDMLTYLDVTAIVLANLCVAYIMTSANEKAEDIMRQVEQAEEAFKKAPGGKGRKSKDASPQSCYHLCIINLVIGTLYCSKGNFEFGISRIMKSMEPFEDKLGTDTWFYAKRGFLSLIETLAREMILLPDATLSEINDFLRKIEQHGSSVIARAGSISAAVTEEGDSARFDESGNMLKTSDDIFVSQEARLLRSIFSLLHV